MMILFKLLAVHLFVDFVLQTSKGVDDKFARGLASGHLWIHVFLHFCLTYLVIGNWYEWRIPLALATSHLIIDYWKISTKRDGLPVFLLDQLLHFIMLVLAFLGYVGTDYFLDIVDVSSLINRVDVWVVLSAFILVIWPVGYGISKATTSWREEIESAEAERDSLSKAGMYIGIFERILVLIFVLSGRMEAIGFLIAAKSILRFGDRHEANPRKNTEYVLIGTLMSFTISILIGLGVLFALNRLI